MSRDTTPYIFVEADPQTIVKTLTAKYESIAQRTVHPASPEKLFIQWVAAAMVLLAEQINFAGNQNIPSKAVGTSLDNIAQIFFNKTRPQAKPATVTMQFTISEAQATAILIPAGTKVTTADQKVVFVTDSDVYVTAGETNASVTATCETAGIVGNGYEAGQLNTCVNPFPYYKSCTNTDESDTGSDVLGDEEFYEMMVASQDAYSCAGAKGAYEYFAKSVSTEIGDVLVLSNIAPGQVDIYTLMNDGTPASAKIKAEILAACNADEVRPLTDHVVAADPDEVVFNVNITYYVSRSSASSMAEITAAVNAAVDAYILWQTAKIGRDINPSKLIQMVVSAGAKRVVVTSPAFTSLKDGTTVNEVPEHAKVGTVTVTNGGYEDE